MLQDLTSVLNLQKKHALLENDVNAHSDRVEVARKQAQQFTEANHFDAPNIQTKTETLVQRWVTADSSPSSVVWLGHDTSL